MKKSNLIALFFLVITITACGAGEATPTPTEDVSAPVLASDILIAEGRVEPIRFTELALNTSGLVSDVPASEGSPIKAGDIIARLEGAQTQTLEDAKANAYQE